MKLAVITGGSRGLGEALCREYLALGWRVVELSRSGHAEYSVHADLSDPAAAGAVFRSTLAGLAGESHDEVVAVSNAAALEPIGPVERLAAEAIVSNVNVNVASQVLFARAVVDAFQGHDCPKTLVNVSSGAAVKGHAGWSLYCAGKAAMENFVRAHALEQRERPHPILAVSIDPFVMDTDMQATIRATDLADFPTRDRYVGFKEKGVLAPPDAVARAIVRIVERRPEPGSRVEAAGELQR